MSKKNWLIEVLYARGEYEEALEIIEDTKSEYGLYVKGLIKRENGQIQESLSLFRKAYEMNRTNTKNLKEIGYSQYLLGQDELALSTCKKAIEFEQEESSRKKDWQLWYNCGLCYEKMSNYDQAIEAYKKANEINRNEKTFIRLAKVYQKKNLEKNALRAYQDALDCFPDNANLLTMVGLAYLKLGETQKSFDFLTKAIASEPKHLDAILALGSILQNNGDTDLALQKYRISAVLNPHCPRLWNNIAMALFQKGKFISAIACLQKAHAAQPLGLWQIPFNLGIIHLHNQQYVSAFHYFSATTRLQTNYAPAFHYLALALAHLQDAESTRAAFHSAISIFSPNLDDELSSTHKINPLLLMTRLNYIIFLYNEEGDFNHQAHSEFSQHIKPFLDDKSLDADFIERARSLEQILLPFSSSDR